MWNGNQIPSTQVQCAKVKPTGLQILQCTNHGRRLPEPVLCIPIGLCNRKPAGERPVGMLDPSVAFFCYSLQSVDDFLLGHLTKRKMMITLA